MRVWCIESTELNLYFIDEHLITWKFVQKLNQNAFISHMSGWYIENMEMDSYYKRSKNKLLQW